MNGSQSEAEEISELEADSSDDLARAILSQDMGRDEDRLELIAAVPLAVMRRSR